MYNIDEVLSIAHTQCLHAAAMMGREEEFMPFNGFLSKQKILFERFESADKEGSASKL